MDVDRFDYMMRDALHTGQSDLVFHPEIYMNNFKIVDNRLAYQAKISNKIFEFFNHRYKLFKNLYLNRKATGIEYMIADLFTMCNQEFKFDEVVFDPKRYLRLTNSVMYDIEKYGDSHPEVAKLYNRIVHRDNYKFVNEYFFNKSTKHRHSSEDLKKIKEVFLSCQAKGEESRLTDENTIITWSMLKYCEEQQFDNILVVDYDNTLKKASSYQNMMNVDKYYEYKIMCYVKEKHLEDNAGRTWTAFIQQYKHILDIK